MGDLNGRTKVSEDFVRDNSDDHSPINLRTTKGGTGVPQGYTFFTCSLTIVD